MPSPTFTVRVPPQMFDAVDARCAAEKRTRTDLVRDALTAYLASDDDDDRDSTAA